MVCRTRSLACESAGSVQKRLNWLSAVWTFCSSLESVGRSCPLTCRFWRSESRLRTAPFSTAKMALSKFTGGRLSGFGKSSALHCTDLKIWRFSLMSRVGSCGSWHYRSPRLALASTARPDTAAPRFPPELYLSSHWRSAVSPLDNDTKQQSRQSRRARRFLWLVLGLVR